MLVLPEADEDEDDAETSTPLFPTHIMKIILFLAFLLSFCISASSLHTTSRPRFPNPTNGAQKYGLSSTSEGSYNYTIEYYTQVLDHFSFRNESTFQQRYLVDKEHWKGAELKGPIFLYCGNEGNIEWFAANSGFLWDIAPQFGALILFPEVRKHS